MFEESLQTAVTLCKEFEGFSSTPYICPAGYATIGYGTVYKPDGAKVSIYDEPISEELAWQWLLHELKSNYLVGVLRASPGLAGFPNALAAVTDFAYNLGVPRYRASTLRKKIDLHDWQGARHELSRWVRGGGRILGGLVRRRAAEAALLPGAAA